MELDLKFLINNDRAVEAARDLVVNDSCNFRLSRKFQIYYRFFRPIMPIAIRQILQRRRKIETEDDWFLPSGYLKSMSACLDNEGQGIQTIHPWPNHSQFGFVLTHDVETAEGMRYIPKIADREEALGLRSSWNLIPYKYKIDMGLVKDLQSRGFEIGIHGFNHDGQLYASHREFKRRAKHINEAIRKYDAVGFRSPMVHRNLNWLQSLEIEYDGSCFDIDPFQAAPGGVGSIWPFIAGRFVELPYTLPQDHTLFVGLGDISDRIWRDKLEFIRRHQGMALMLTHPDYLTGKKESDAYFQFLQHVKDVGEYWHATPMDTARWWRKREQAMEFDLDSIDHSVCDSINQHKETIAAISISSTGIQFKPKR